MGQKSFWAFLFYHHSFFLTFAWLGGHAPGARELGGNISYGSEIPMDIRKIESQAVFVFVFSLYFS